MGTDSLRKEVKLKVVRVFLSQEVNCVLVAQPYPTLCDPIDCSPAGYMFMECSMFMEFSRREYWSGLPFPSPRGQLPEAKFMW